MALAAAPASAGLYHPNPPAASFGPLGGSCAEGSLATGTGDAVIATGSGNLAKGSTEVADVTASQGAFEVGMVVESESESGQRQLPTEAIITAVQESSPGVFKLTLSEAASGSASGASLAAGFFVNVTAGCGSFAVGQDISAPILPKSDQHSGRIIAVGPGHLTVHSPPRESGTGVALTALSVFPFGTAENLAFDQAASRLYAIRSEGPLLYGFDLSAPGSYSPLAAPFPLPLTEKARPSYVAVDNSGGPHQGDIYADSYQVDAQHPGELFCYEPGGALCPGFPKPPPKTVEGYERWGPLAVDPSGNLWVDAFHSFSRMLREFSPAGAELGHTDVYNSPALRGEEITALAFDAAGHLYVGSNNGAWRLTLPGLEAPLEIDGEPVRALAVDRSTGDLYVSQGGTSGIARYDAAGEPVESFPAASALLTDVEGIAVDEATKAVFASMTSIDDLQHKSPFQTQIRVFQALTLPDLATAPLSGLGETSVTLNGAVHPDGLALSACRFEWVSEAAYLQSGFGDLSSGGEHECEPAFGGIPTAGTTPVSAPVSGLAPEGRYRYRLSAADANGENHSKTAAFALAKPGAETLGSPIRTATTARLDSRIDPHGIATEYSFQYLTEAQYEADGESFGAGTRSTEAKSAGSGGLIELASEEVTELSPATAYRYRVLAENAAFGAAAGEARTLTTRSPAEESPSHGPYPGPPGSDRAWEQVNLPDTSGNPVNGVEGIAASGEAAVYSIAGGTSVSESGTLDDFLFARRPPGAHPSEGWRTEAIFPSRKDAAFSAWLPLSGAPDLSTVLGLNRDLAGNSRAGVWRMPTAGGAPEELYEAGPGAYVGPYLFSEDGSRALLALEGGALDPGHHSPQGVPQLYDVSSGQPRMASLLPGAGPGAEGPKCGLARGPIALSLNTERVYHDTYWVSANGRYAFFPSAGEESPGCGAPHLYMRDLVAEKTIRVDALETSPGAFGPLSGPDCPGVMIRSTPDAVYLWTQSRLTEEDTAIAGGCQSPGESAAGGDVYRYQISSHEFACLTCVVPGGQPANVAVGGETEGGIRSIAVAPEGPRLYFTTRSQLLPGASQAGKPAIYRVDTETHQLAYVAPLNSAERVGENPIGAFEGEGTAISPNGRYLEFRSAAAGLNQLSGSENGGTPQLYLYDDGDEAAAEGRSLSCASCPPDGSAPRGAAGRGIIFEAEPAPNMTSLADDGDLAFATPTPLVSADRNTAPAGQNPEAGTDVYEWRDGRALLVSDGQSGWLPETGPRVASISPSGRDIFFTEAARLTPDAPDGYARLYDARIGGGIDFPEAQKPCSLEACQGTPKGAPGEAAPGSASFAGPGNVKEEAPRPRCAKGRVRKGGKCVARHAKKHRAKHRKRSRRAAERSRRAPR